MAEAKGQGTSGGPQGRETLEEVLAMVNAGGHFKEVKEVRGRGGGPVIVSSSSQALPVEKEGN